MWMVLLLLKWVNIFKKYEKIDVLSKFGPCTYVLLIIQMDVI